MEKMKKITVRMVEGVPLFMPSFVDEHFPTLPMAEFPHFCGAGTGIAEKLVPDHILWLYVSIACWIHDCMFCLSSPTKENWFVANGLLVLNLFMLIIVKGSKWMVAPRCAIAVPYFFGVMSGTGWKVFTNRDRVDDYDPYKDEELVKKFSLVGVDLRKVTPERGNM